MFAVHYKWRLVPDSEAAFRTAWRVMTEAIRGRYGTRGSRLHRTDDGLYVAYAVWPSRADWEAAGKQPSVDPDSLAAMKACIAESFGATPLEVIDDRLT